MLPNAYLLMSYRKIRSHKMVCTCKTDPEFMPSKVSFLVEKSVSFIQKLSEGILNWLISIPRMASSRYINTRPYAWPVKCTWNDAFGHCVVPFSKLVDRGCLNTARHIVTNGVHDLWGTMCLLLLCLYWQKKKYSVLTEFDEQPLKERQLLVRYLWHRTLC